MPSRYFRIELKKHHAEQTWGDNVGQDVIAVPAGLALCAILRQPECANNDKLYRQK